MGNALDWGRFFCFPPLQNAGQGCIITVYPAFVHGIRMFEINKERLCFQ